MTEYEKQPSWFSLQALVWLFQGNALMHFTAYFIACLLLGALAGAVLLVDYITVEVFGWYRVVVWGLVMLGVGYYWGSSYESAKYKSQR